MNTENIKLIVCDVDNTLIPQGESRMSTRNKEALQKAIAKGYKVFVNTGRHYTFLQPSLFEDLPMDIIGTINGACVVDHDGKVLQKTPMSLDTMNQITKLCIDHNLGLGFKFEDAIVCYANYEKFISYYAQRPEEKKLVIDDSKDRKHHELVGTPLGTFIIGESEVIEPLKENFPELKFAWSFRSGYDVFLKSITKANSIEAVLKMYNMTWDNVIGFGDAGNDTPFIEKSAIGVCMGNSKDDVKDVADIVARDCKDDAIAHVLEELGLI